MFNSGNATPFSMPVAPIGYGGGNGGGFGGWGDDWIALAIIAMIFGYGNFGMGGMGGMGMFLPFMMGGFGGFDNGNASLTRADLCSEFNFNNLESAVRGVQQGICDSTFALNNTITNGFAGVNNAVCDLGFTMQNGFNATQVANMQGNFALQNAINDNTVAGMQNTNALSTQLANCCCENRVGQMQIQNQMAADTCAITNQANTNTRDIIDSQNAGFRAILDKMCQQELAAKDATIAAQNQRIFGLELAASQSNQNAVLMASMDANKAEILRKTGAECPTAAYIVQPPQPVTFPTNCCGTFSGYGNGGCNSGCC